MSDVKLDSELFFRRAEKIFSAWEVSYLTLALYG